MHGQTCDKRWWKKKGSQLSQGAEFQERIWKEWACLQSGGIFEVRFHWQSVFKAGRPYLDRTQSSLSFDSSKIDKRKSRTQMELGSFNFQVGCHFHMDLNKQSSKSWPHWLPTHQLLGKGLTKLKVTLTLPAANIFSYVLFCLFSITHSFSPPVQNLPMPITLDILFSNSTPCSHPPYKNTERTCLDCSAWTHKWQRQSAVWDALNPKLNPKP